MNVLFLYAQIVPSWNCVFEALVNKGFAIHVVHWDKNKKTPYEPVPIEGVHYYKRSDFDINTLKNLAFNLSPKIIFVSGWMDLGYLYVCFFLRRKKLPVVFGCDDWWRNSLKQKFGAMVPALVRQMFLSHGWVAGPRQYEYCKRLGFNDSEIIHNFLTCDTNFFDIRQLPRSPAKTCSFVYVGRFSREKGIENLVKAFKYYRTELEGSWTLTCVGNGPLSSLLTGVEGIEVRGFADMTQLRACYAEARVFVLPSLRDFSPLVLHEAVSMSLPILVSDMVGNAVHFSVIGYNSIQFSYNNWLELASAFCKFEKMDNKSLNKMGLNSRILSSRNNPEIAARSFLSLMK